VGIVPIPLRRPPLSEQVTGGGEILSAACSSDDTLGSCAIRWDRAASGTSQPDGSTGFFKRLESQVELVELKEKVTMSREEAAARLHAIADELGANNDVVIEREHIRFVAHVPDRVNLKVEFEIEDDGTELEIELTW
jgi:amphi-Trp domain-containing protein